MLICRLLITTLLLTVTSTLAIAANNKDPAVLIKTLSAQRLISPYENIGRVNAVASIEVIARADGMIKKRLFNEGSYVKEGQILFQIEQESYQLKVQQQQAQLAGAQASLKQADANLERSRQLRKNQVISKAEYEIAKAKRDQLKAQVLQAQAALKQAQLNLSYTRISSPVSGFTGKASVNTGSLVSADKTKLVTVTSTDPIYVDLAVSDKLLLSFRQKGSLNTQRITPSLYLSNGDDYPHKGQVDFIGHQVSRETDTVDVRLSFPNPKGVLLPGQVVNISIAPKEAPAVIAVPQMAVQRDRQGTFVMLVDSNNKIVQRHIKLGKQVGTQWIVLSGLKAGERVVTQGLQKIHTGLTVQPSEQ